MIVAYSFVKTDVELLQMKYCLIEMMPDSINKSTIPKPLCNFVSLRHNDEPSFKKSLPQVLRKNP